MKKIKSFKSFDKLNESFNLSKNGEYQVKYPVRGMDLYEAILAQLFSDFKNRVSDENRDYYSDNDKRRILTKFQEVFDSCRRRFGKGGREFQDSLEDLIDLSNSTGLERQIESLLKDLGIERLTINWDEDNPMTDRIKSDEETRVTKKIFGII